MCLDLGLIPFDSNDRYIARQVNAFFPRDEVRIYTVCFALLENNNDEAGMLRNVEMRTDKRCKPPWVSQDLMSQTHVAFDLD